MGFRAGRGAASFRRRAEAWKLRDESARRVPLASILDDAGVSIADWVARRRGCEVRSGGVLEGQDESELKLRVGEYC